MRKKRVMLWLLLCGVCVAGGSLYLNKTEPLKATEKSETAQTKKTAPTAETKAVAKAPAVTQTSEEMVPVGPPDAQYSVLPNFNFQDLYGNLDPVQENRASMPVGFGFSGSKAESTGTTYYGLFQTYLPATAEYGSYNAFQPTDPFDQQYYVRYKHTMHSIDYQSEFHWQRLPKPDAPNQSEGLAFAYGTNIKNGASNGPQGGLITNEPIIKYNPEETFGFVYGEYELGSPNYFSDWAAEEKPNSSKSILQVYLKDTRTSALTGAVDVGKVSDLFATPSGSFFKGFTKDVFTKTDNGYDNKYFGIFLENAYHYPIFLRNWMVLMTSVTANPTPIDVHLGEDITPYLTETALKKTLGDIYYYPDPENTDYDFDDPEGGSKVDKNTLSDIRILATAEPKSNLIGQKKIVIQFKYETPDTHETKTGVVPVDFNVTAGNSIFLGGTATTGTPYKDNPNLSSLAFSLNQTKSGDYQIAATNGNNVYGDETFNTRANEAQPYYQVDYFAPPADGETLNLNQDLTTKGAENGSLVAVKDSTPNGLISSWGTDGKLDVELGGVLRVYTYDPTKEWLYQSDVLNNEFVPSDLPQRNYVFYQVTEDGLEPMYTNQMKLNTPAVANQLTIGINAPALALSNLFNTSPVANSRYLTPFDGTLADYTFVWDFLEGSGTKTQRWYIPANVIIQKPDSPIVFTVPLAPFVNVTSTAYIPYIPDLPYWENSADPNKFIPADQTFSVAWMPNTEIDTTPGTMQGMINTELGTGQGKLGGNVNPKLLLYNPDTSEKRIRFNNVGYYEGRVVDLQLSWTNQNAGTKNSDRNYIGTENEFLRFGFSTSSAEECGIKNLTFEFYNHGDYENPLNVSGYWHFSKFAAGSSLIIPNSEIDHIFSLPAPKGTGTPPNNATDVTQMRYEEKVPDMRFYTPAGGIADGVQREMTITYKNQTAFHFDYLYSYKDNYDNFLIGQDTKARVEFPAPQGINQQYSKVTKANDPDGNDTLSEKFVQYVPYQSEAYHPTELSWTLPNTEGTPASGLPLQAILKDDKWDWEVIDAATGDDASSWFNSPDGATLEAKDLTNQDFYNKFFIIQRKLKINDADPVSPDDLHTIDGLAGKYYTLEGAENQKLTLDGELTFNGDTTTIGPLESGTFTTSVNFEANLAPYTYKVAGKELTAEQVAAADLPTSSGDTQSYITHDLSDLVLGAHANMLENITMDDGKKYSLQTITIDGQAYTVVDGKLDPELTEKIKYTNTPVTLSYEEFVPWLPFYDKWKNSAKDTIPGSNSFVFRFSQDPANPTTVVAAKNLTKPQPGDETVNYGSLGAGQTGSLVFNNLGSYKGQKVAVKMSVTPEKNAPSWASNLTTIGVGSKNFFNVGMALSMNSVKVKYEFLEQTADAWQNWKPIKISGYWSLSNMWDNKDIAIPNDLIKNIYSFNRNYKQGDTALPIQLKYAEGPDNLTISSAATGSTVPPEQTSATITYDDQEYFQYTMIAASGGTTNATVKYISSSYARIDIPAPEGLEQSVAEVTDKQYPDGDDKIAKPINQEFRQAIPYEDPKYQSQPMVWMLPDVAADTNTLKSNGQWTIVDETGTDAIKDGRFAVDNDHQNKVSAADITNDNLYDHTYTFQRNLVINDQAPVDVNSEDFDKDTNYLDSKGDVSLQVGEVGKVDPLTSPVSTKVNFAADLGFAYHEYKPDDDELVTTPFATTPTYGEAAKEVPTAGTGLITHSYNDLQTLGGEPLGENENLMSVLSNINVGDEGYTLNPEKSDPALSTPVKFTTGNNSKLAYALGAVFTFDVTPNLDFGTPEIGMKDIRQTNDWSLNVANTPKASKIMVSRTPFKAADVERLLGAQLLLNFDDNAALATKEIPVSTEEAPASVELKTLAAKATWTIDALATPSDPQMPIGFSLNVPAGNITAGKQYKSEITFTLTDAP